MNGCICPRQCVTELNRSDPVKNAIDIDNMDYGSVDRRNLLSRNFSFSFTGLRYRLNE